MRVCMLCYPQCPGGCWHPRAVKITLPEEQRAQCNCRLRGSSEEHARAVHGMSKAEYHSELCRLRDERLERVRAQKARDWQMEQDAYEAAANKKKNKITLPDSERDPEGARRNIAPLPPPKNKSKRATSPTQPHRHGC